MKNNTCAQSQKDAYMIRFLSKSRMDIESIFPKLIQAKGNQKSITFKAKDVQISGSALRSLTQAGVVKVVDQELINVVLPNGETIQSPIYIYKCDVDLNSLAKTVIENRKAHCTAILDEVERRETKLKNQMKKIKARATTLRSKVNASVDALEEIRK